MVSIVCERGFAAASVTAVSARAKVSRQTFYDAFETREDCFLAVLDEGYAQAVSLVSRAFQDARRRHEGPDATLAGLRGALMALLSFFDSQPRLARAWLVESLAAGAWALERRERHVTALTRLIVESHSVRVEPHPLASTGAMASVLGIIQSHLIARNPEPLLTLLGPLMGVVVAPYLEPPVVIAEIARGEVLAQKLLAEHTSRPRQADDGDPGVPRLLCDARARRARDCLRHLAEHPGASNRQVAAAVGIARDSHISTLLARLHRMGLVVKSKGRPGAPNAWSLSPYGLEVARALQTAKTADESCVKS
jgi:AcrR family transcriptional regulator